METPITRFVDSVYDPAEDSFLLIDAIESELDSIKHSEPAIALEIGCGSGVVITALAKCLDDCIFLASDVNPRATECARETASRHLGRDLLQTVLSDMDSSFMGRLDGIVDILICNPPYVPTTDEEAEADDPTKLAWAGGPKGTNLVERLLPRASELLSRNGRFYLLLVKENDPEGICGKAADLGLKSELVMQRRCRNEHLFVYKFFK